MPVGKLRVYLGAAPGVGKTYAMLDEGVRRSARGATVAIGVIESHGRKLTEEKFDTALTQGLPLIALRSLDYRGAQLRELDVDAIIAAHPKVVLIDELAHTNVPGSKHTKRFEDVQEILAAGIDVISTVNIQHLESLNDVVESITGVRQRETIPDAVLRGADQIQLVDMTPEALRRRLAHGNVYQPEKIDAALSNYFRVGNLAALRELALLWLADRVDERLEAYRGEQGIRKIWAARERTVVAVTGGPESATLLRRGARIAGRGAGGELTAVYVARSDGLSEAPPSAITELRRLTESLGGSFQVVTGDSAPRAILDYARSVNAARIVLGQSRHRELHRVLGRSVSDAVIDGSGDIDVHVVTHSLGRGRGRVARGRTTRRRDAGNAIGARRTIAGWLVALVGAPVLTVLLSITGDWHALPTELMSYLALVVLAAIVGGLLPALAAAVVGTVLVNYFFTPPTRTFTIEDPENAFALLVFVVVGAAVASVVSLSARQTLYAARARRDADVLSGLADTLLAAEDELPALLEQIRTTFGLDGVAVVRHARSEGPVTAPSSAQLANAENLRSVGWIPSDEPAESVAAVTPELTVTAYGRHLSAEEHLLFAAFAAHVAARIDRTALESEAKHSRELADANQVRTALLSAVSHDLRTPLAGIKAAVGSLRSDDVEWNEADEAELLEAIELSADRLDGLIGNLLDMSRLQTDSLTLLAREVGVDEVIPGALANIPPSARLTVTLAEDTPPAYADPGLLERVIANLAENAVRHSPGAVTISVSATGPARGPEGAPGPAARVQVHVVDHGRGVDQEAREQMFAPFQRFGDVPAGNGVGLGLAVAKGLTEAMHGTIRAEDTPGGGLTMVVDLPTAPPATPAKDPR